VAEKARKYEIVRGSAAIQPVCFFSVSSFL